MRERVQQHARALKVLDWKSDALVLPSGPINALLKETTTMYKVLAQILPQKQLETVFADIYLMLNSKYIETFTGYNVTGVAKHR